MWVFIYTSHSFRHINLSFRAGWNLLLYDVSGYLLKLLYINEWLPAKTIVNKCLWRLNKVHFYMRMEFLREDMFIPESAVLLQKCLNSVHPAFAWLIIPVWEKGYVRTSAANQQFSLLSRKAFNFYLTNIDANKWYQECLHTCVVIIIVINLILLITMSGEGLEI